MRLLIATAVAAPLILSMPGPVGAQSFLEGLARRAADRVAAAAVERVESAAAGEASSGARSGDGPATETGDAGTAPAAARTTGPAPWPLNPEDVTYTGDLEFDAADEVRVAGLHEFSKVDCMACEGGYSYDSWITYHTDMTVDQVAAHVGGLGVGQTLSWTGVEAAGRLEVVSEVPVGPFACKQVRTVMTRGEAVYEAPGLYCFGKSHSFAKEMWVEVVG